MHTGKLTSAMGQQVIDESSLLAPRRRRRQFKRRSADSPLSHITRLNTISLTDANISPLETSVSIVHIPVHLAHLYTNELYWTLERAKECVFFNLTANRIEVSL